MKWRIALKLQREPGDAPIEGDPLLEDPLALESPPDEVLPMTGQQAELKRMLGEVMSPPAKRVVEPLLRKPGDMRAIHKTIEEFQTNPASLIKLKNKLSRDPLSPTEPPKGVVHPPGTRLPARPGKKPAPPQPGHAKSRLTREKQVKMRGRASSWLRAQCKFAQMEMPPGPGMPPEAQELRGPQDQQKRPFMDEFLRHMQAENRLVEWQGWVDSEFQGLANEESALRFLMETDPHGEVPQWAKDACDHDFQFKGTDEVEEGAVDVFECTKCGETESQAKGFRGPFRG